jgi:hypothetical protein
MASPLPRLRRLCLALPHTHEVEAWGAPTFRIKDGKIFAMYASAKDHHGKGRNSVWIKATKENQVLMIRAQPDRFFSPPYTGPSGWIGVYLDESPDWDEVRELLQDGWRQIAPKKLLNESSKPEEQRPKTKVQTPPRRSAARRKTG